MLALSRKANEEIVVMIEGVEVARVKVFEIKGGRVKLGLSAEPNVKFVRSELLGEKTDGRV